MTKQLTKEVWESFTDQQRFGWLLVTSLSKNGELEYGMPYWKLFKESDFSLRWTWEFDGEKLYVAELVLMNYQDGVDDWGKCMTGLLAVRPSS